MKKLEWEGKERAEDIYRRKWEKGQEKMAKKRRIYKEGGLALDKLSKRISVTV